MVFLTIMSAACPRNHIAGTSFTTDADSYFFSIIWLYTFNTMGVASTDDITKKLFAAFNGQLRDEMGIKFQFLHL